MSGDGEAKFRLKNAHLIQVKIHQRLFHLGQTELGGLHPIAVGDVNKINLRHLTIHLGESLMAGSLVSPGFDI